MQRSTRLCVLREGARGGSRSYVSLPWQTTCARSASPLLSSGASSSPVAVRGGLRVRGTAWGAWGLARGSSSKLSARAEAMTGLVLVRHYAQAKKMSGVAYRPRVFIPSLGQIADPVVPPSGADLLSPAKLWARVRSTFANLASLWQIRKQLKKEKYSAASWFVLGRWTAEAAQQYRAFCEARANGNGKALRSLTTDEFFDVIKGSTIEPSNKLTREWDLRNLRAKVLALRMVALQEPDVKFAQMLVRFTSQQKFKITDARGALVAGDPSPLPVHEYYVLERPLQDMHLFEWKIMGKLDPNRKEPLTKPMLEQ